VSQSEEDILVALIIHHTGGSYKNTYGEHRTYPSEESARKAARKILSCGFSMARRPVDDLQNADIERLERDVEQLRGWSGLPPELRRG
jgi:hypothetical protein